FVDSLAVPAGELPTLNLNLDSGPNSSAATCGVKGAHAGGKTTKTKSSSALTHGGSSGSSAGGSTSLGSGSGSSSSSGSVGSGSFSQPASSATGSGAEQQAAGLTGNPAPASSTGFTAALKKPLWLLVAFLVWQALMIVTGVSVWHWKKGGVS
ncbi:MAG TPA: hypothetical protein VGQ38_13425, partial [Gaiellaceae bacterium]|nr:hypothetical protein [Gaiellaceae bacterium]